MARQWTAALALVALGSAPALAAPPVSGLYAGILAGVVAPAATDLTVGGRVVEFETDDAAPLHAGPVSVVGPAIDADFLGFLNRALAAVAHPTVGAGIDFALAGTLAHDRGSLGGAVLGYGFGNGVRVEAELSATGFAGADAGLNSGRATLVVGGTTDSAWGWSMLGEEELPPDAGGLPLPTGGAVATAIQFLLASAWYDVETGTRLVPYVGAGLGLARVTATYGEDCGCGATAASAIVPAAQLGAGLRVALGEPVTLDVGYRLRLATSGPSLVESLADPGFAAAEAHIGQSGPLLVHALQVGLSFALE